MSVYMLSGLSCSTILYIQTVCSYTLTSSVLIFAFKSLREFHKFFSQFAKINTHKSSDSYRFVKITTCVKSQRFKNRYRVNVFKSHKQKILTKISFDLFYFPLLLVSLSKNYTA